MREQFYPSSVASRTSSRHQDAVSVSTAPSSGRSRANRTSATSDSRRAGAAPARSRARKTTCTVRPRCGLHQRERRKPLEIGPAEPELLLGLGDDLPLQVDAGHRGAGDADRPAAGMVDGVRPALPQDRAAVADHGELHAERPGGGGERPGAVGRVPGVRRGVDREPIGRGGPHHQDRPVEHVRVRVQAAALVLDPGRVGGPEVGRRHELHRRHPVERPDGDAGAHTSNVRLTLSRPAASRSRSSVVL